MSKHMTCIRAAMERGMAFMSGLKADMSGGLSIMRTGRVGRSQDYLGDEPLSVHGIQEYGVIGFNAHYINKDPEG